MTNFADFRSDTVTQPTEKMKKAVMFSKMGDDFYNEDITTIELEEKAAKILGKEAALFVPTGVMGNQIAVMAHTNKGDELICHEYNHIFENEGGAASILSCVSIRTTRNERCTVTKDELISLIRPNNILKAKTSLLCLENATSLGTVLSIEEINEVCIEAKKRGLKTHLDGARIFNAAHSLGVDVKQITEHFDSVMFCLSKGLCAPIGSIISGSKEFIEKAKRYRKILGGGMRQTGFITICGIIALDEMRERLKEDNENAKYIAKSLKNINGVSCNEENTQINIVFIKIDKSLFKINEFINKCSENNFKILPPDDNGDLRLVTNISTTRKDCEKIVDIIKNCSKE